MGTLFIVALLVFTGLNVGVSPAREGEHEAEGKPAITIISS